MTSDQLEDARQKARPTVDLFLLVLPLIADGEEDDVLAEADGVATGERRDGQLLQLADHALVRLDVVDAAVDAR